jgi:hypothetical protein
MSLKTYPKSSFWSKTDTILLTFLILGSGLALADDLESFLVTVAISAAVFGLYFGVNWLVKTKLYKSEIAVEVSLDKSKKTIQIGNQKIKFGQIQKIHTNHLRRIGWRFVIQTEKTKIKFILPEQKEVLTDLKEVLEVEVFAKNT